MKAENKAFLEQFRQHYVDFQRAGVIKHLSLVNQRKMAEVAKEEFDHRFTITPGCPTCIADMINYVFTQLDKNEPDKASTEISQDPPADDEKRTADRPQGNNGSNLQRKGSKRDKGVHDNNGQDN